MTHARVPPIRYPSPAMRPGLWWALCSAFFTLSVTLLSPAAAQTDAARAEARVHFTRGLELFDEGRLVEALSEFEEAYRISPAPALLYNLAQIHAELGHAVEAADAYQRFLSDSPSIDPELRADAERALRVQRARIGRLEVTVSVEGTRIFVDDVEVGSAPLSAPVPVSAGEHVVVAQTAGFEAQRHRFRVAGGATYRVELVLVPSGSRGASLRIESVIPGVEVRVDGASLGLTPLDATVPVSAGAHRVEGTRDGYVPFALEVVAADGSETRVVVQTRPDDAAPASTRAALRIALPSASSTVRLDGEVIDGALEVPVGLHDLEIRVAEREPIDERIDVPPGDGLSLEPAYRWTPDARQERVAAADSQRTAGIAAAITGAIAFALGAGTLVADAVWYAENVDGPSSLEMPCAGQTMGMLTPSCLSAVRAFTGNPMADYDTYALIIDRYQADVSVHYTLLGVGIGLSALGAVSLGIGIALIAGAPSEADIDRGARADFTLELDLSPDHVGLRGTF